MNMIYIQSYKIIKERIKNVIQKLKENKLITMNILHKIIKINIQI